MRVYLAASFNQQKRIAQLSQQLEELGIQVTNRWQEEPAGIPESEYRGYGERDLESVRLADVLVVLTDRPSTTGGYHFECGYAYALKKPILVVGDRVNFFLHLKEISRVKEWREAKLWLVKNMTKANVA